MNLFKVTTRRDVLMGDKTESCWVNKEESKYIVAPNEQVARSVFWIKHPGLSIHFCEKLQNIDYIATLTIVSA